MRKTVFAAWAVWLLFAAGVTFFGTGCSPSGDDDGRQENLLLEFRYTNGQADTFNEKITSLRHFLFDGSGVLLRVLEADPDNRRQVWLSLDAGAYALVSVGNLGPTEQIDARPGHTTADELRLELARPNASEEHGPCGRLYYGYREFAVVAGARNRYVCDMAHSHGVLHVAVRWKNGPPSDPGPYTFRLSNVAGRYSGLLPAHTVRVYAPVGDPSGAVEPTDERIVHHFPRPCPEVKVTHRSDAFLYNNELQTTFRTLRYRDDDLPRLQLFRGDRPLTPLIDLTPFFRGMGWVCDRNIEQVYSIVLEIDPASGTVAVRSGEDSASDWTDGGSVS